ncbi:hypothetical protein ACGFMM_31320 [Streptomyces sp. NPDC048604]|uniref:hypothetical protein n=1 Tax=Streptomyces sp. NPDC048604 TaxID=3365578 RepID=UPI00370FE6E4
MTAHPLARRVPRLIVTVELLHFVRGLAQPHAWGAIVRDGVLRAVVDTNARDHFLREFSVWWTVSGVALLAARHPATPDPS